jgi:hypothetical protein
MTAHPFRVIWLGRSHDRGRFNSGSEPLDRYFRGKVLISVIVRTIVSVLS